MKDLVIRTMQKSDCEIIAQARGKLASQYEGYLTEQTIGERTVLVAERRGTLLGYITIVWEAGHEPFRAQGIPEIGDFNVFGGRRQGVGTALIEEAERRMARVVDAAGVGVGLTPEYGPAQRLYAKRGFVPDGRGIWYNDHYVKLGDTVVVDHGLILWQTKTLR